uniref:Uncharacterized protein n=1 Tax=Eutreptiella gymnastica TaxID=73025 RepID=A0A7S1J206_9EUGL|mmetsp:Transcript_60864/g.108634  ORF Transcript_60864/g.108634 Transcript_60864/m.108634 type:complete len:129 (+) Transcript_60864:130-516(+)
MSISPEQRSKQGTGIRSANSLARYTGQAWAALGPGPCASEKKIRQVRYGGWKMGPTKISSRTPQFVGYILGHRRQCRAAALEAPRSKAPWGLTPSIFTHLHATYTDRQQREGREEATLDRWNNVRAIF